MREYRKRKRLAKAELSASLPSMPSVVRAPEPSLNYGQAIEQSEPHSTPNTGFVRKGARSSFKTALELARTFPFGVLSSAAESFKRPHFGDSSNDPRPRSH
jgi:hypothetical protein